MAEGRATPKSLVIGEAGSGHSFLSEAVGPISPHTSQTQTNEAKARSFRQRDGPPRVANFKLHRVIRLRVGRINLDSRLQNFER